MAIDARAGGVVFLLVLAGILLLGGCGTQSGKGGPAAPPAPEVAVATIAPQRLTLTTELTGRTSSHQVAEVRPQVGGIVRKRLFVEGADVKEGQPLFQIDPAPYQAALSNARATLAKAEAGRAAIQARVDRLRELLPDKAVSQQDYDDAATLLKQNEADIQFGRAAVETAQINLGYTQVRAPIAGRIGKSSVTEGALVTASQPVALVTIQQMDPIYVDVTQSTTELLRLQHYLEDGRLHRDGTSRKVRLILEDGLPHPWAGSLQFRDVTVDPSTGSVTLRILAPNPKGTLLPGMFVRALVEEGVNRQAILVPQEAVSRDPKGNPVALIVDGAGKVQQRLLALDRAIDNRWLVASGLAAGDRLIVEGGLKVKPGMPVKVVPWGNGPETQAGGQRPPAAGSAPKAK
ncbi:MAG: efflux RND transporter periplasmic adaptor subunit [Deltaproteobacteria bacterium]|nr:efflux RND transporter periplasmic adaptor subunit [Deltaproteobacteria bacterium]